MAIVISITFLTFLIHSIEEDNIRDVLYSNQIEIQQTVTERIASNVSLELELILLELTLLANSNELQESVVDSKSLELLRNSFHRINGITQISALFLTDKDATVLTQLSVKTEDILGIQLSGPPIDKVQETLKPDISSWLGPEIFGYQFAMIHPIINEEDNSLKGMLVVAIPAETFFVDHGNIYDDESRFFLMALDKHQDFMVGPHDELIGQNVQEEAYQKFIGGNEVINSLYDSVFVGNSDSAIYALNGEERIMTGMPVLINGEKILYIFVTTPTSTISSQIDDIIAADKIITSIILATIAGILILLFIRVAKNLEKEKLVMIGKLSSNIAHDMRNPLGTIKSSIRRIEKHNEQNNQVINDETQRINRAINRMSHQVEQVLNYVRTTPLITKKSSIKEMINYALESIKIPDNITVNVPQDDATIECDSEKLEIVFVNLLLNAVQAIDKGEGEINIRIDKQPRQVIIEFENTGSSIPDYVLPKIFDPLFTTKLKGTGLGLSGCKNIIEQHNGTIVASSNPVIFKITLPKLVDDFKAK